MTKPRILIISATGSNRDRDVAWACELAGGAPVTVHLNQVTSGDTKLANYQMLVLPGGFSQGDDLGAGKLWAVALTHRLGDELRAFHAARKPILGICNGFQALVKAGLLPADDGLFPSRPLATLSRNQNGQFECRWVYLAPNTTSPCVFTKGLDEPIHCPVAHGEGQFVVRDVASYVRLETRGGIALRYTDDQGTLAGYPHNPNGSAGNIAGITDPTGTILGLMPHPENHILPEQHPQFHRGSRGGSGLALFQNGIRYAAGV
jgi:phosphoribosylformylglycinamidine synthase subunit PurQ / glutaminase